MTLIGAHFWRSRRGHLEALDPGECRELLGSKVIGRIGFGTPSGPRIIVMNHAVQVDALWFITSADSELAKYAIGQTVAYEVDAIDDFLEAGWSVLATGVLERYDGSATPLSFGPVPDPWPERSDEILLRLSWTDLTGRRLIPG